MRQKIWGDNHLSIVLNNPDKNDNIVLVNVTTYRDGEGKDNTCILNREDHPWLTREKSYVKYDAAEIVKASKIEEYINRRYGSIQAHFDDEVFMDILCSALESEHTSGEVKDFMRNFVDYENDCCESKD